MITAARIAGAALGVALQVAWWRHKLAMPRPLRIERVGDAYTLR